MKKFSSTLIFVSLCTLAVGAMLTACGPTGNNSKKTGTWEEPAVDTSLIQKKESLDAVDKGVYGMEIKPLTPVECGRCHNYQFKWLQDKGGKHQFNCTNCHEQYHAYNPRKGNWDEIMPKCQNCHDLPHDAEFTACLDCHQQPHAPKVIQFAKLERTVESKGGVVVCAVCHSTIGSEFAKFPSLHNTEVNCNGCHAEVHGKIPTCLDCHEPHVDFMEYRDCLTCHSPHSAKNIKQYPEDVPNLACSACHDGPYNNLQTNITKHSSLQCATCHVSHGVIPACQDCHGQPHGEGLHKRFKDCLDCHSDPHNLPVNKKK